MFVISAAFTASRYGDAYKLSRGFAEVSILPALGNATRDIGVALKGTGVTWRGWHALRRGLGTNLAEMGCSDKVIQRILRHARVTVTREHYIKVRDKSVDEAMEKLGNAVGPKMDQSSTENGASQKPN